MVAPANKTESPEAHIFISTLGERKSEVAKEKLQFLRDR